MQNKFAILAMLFCLVLLAPIVKRAKASVENLGKGFYHHGVATPVSNHRGIIATVDGEGRNIVLVWLHDYRGGYALLIIDAKTGKSLEVPIPFPADGDSPFASILSSKNKFYTHFNGYFTEFNPQKRKFTFTEKTTPQMAMGMTEDDTGVIWSVTYPNSGVVSFNPKTKELKDYGSVHSENWRQYQRYVAADDAGWIYFAIGQTASNIIAFDPLTGKSKPIVPKSETGPGTGYVYRGTNGKVYGLPLKGGQDNWYEFYKGQAKKIGKRANIRNKKIITGSQGLIHSVFPDGTLLRSCDLINRKIVIENPKTKTIIENSFDYTSEGAHIMGVAASPDGTICGGTTFPMRFFSYDPETDKWINRKCYGQWNTIANGGDCLFAGVYVNGVLLEWNPAKKWIPTIKGDNTTNPAFLTQAHPNINRPHDLLVHPDGKTVILAGTPGYGRTGGGLLFWDRESQTQTLIKHNDILPDHSTMSLVALAEDKLLAGTTTMAGTGGEQKAEEAELYIMDMKKKVEWHEAVFPGVQNYNDMCLADKGVIYGIADRKLFFVFDPAVRKVIHKEDLGKKFGLTNYHQGSRTFIKGAEKKIYILFVKGIGSIDPATYSIEMLAESPVPIGPGGDILNGSIYFGSKSHLYSYKLPD